jgi:5,10-methenyltetrahydrofolate synthetase
MTQSISRDHANAATAVPATNTPGSITPKAELRAELLARRASPACTAPACHAALAARVASWLANIAPALGLSSVGFYWPTQDEPDLRAVLAAWLAEDPARIAALPVVVDKHQPMVFHRWQPGMPMRRGRYGIDVPAQEEIVSPALLLIPCVGVDARGYRLGYGGGFYDRTLAALHPRPKTLGVAFSATQVSTLPVEAHDIPLDGVLTDAGAFGLGESAT